MRITLDLTPEQVAELRDQLDSQPAATSNGNGLVDAATVAGALGMSREWVYRHSADLGAERIGDGPRPRLRFDLERVKRQNRPRDISAYKPADEPKSPEQPKRRTPKRRAAATALLPIRESCESPAAGVGLPQANAPAARKRPGADTRR